jgi:hypothetical protein
MNSLHAFCQSLLIAGYWLGSTGPRYTVIVEVVLTIVGVLVALAALLTGWKLSSPAGVLTANSPGFPSTSRSSSGWCSRPVIRRCR